MKKHLPLILKVVLLLVICAGIFYFLNRSFDSNAVLRSIFCSSGVESGPVGQLSPSDPATFANRQMMLGRINMFIFTGVNLLQVFALVVAIHVIGGIRKSADTAKLRIKLLENADIFLDIPLYIGLFGTVSSFLVLSFSPTGSRLIAYSSTLIGIIFSLALRLSLTYPLRKKLISEQQGEEK